MSSDTRVSNDSPSRSRLPARWKQRIIVALLLVGGILVSIASFRELNRLRRRELQASFDASAAEIVDHLHGHFQSVFDAVEGTAALFVSSEVVTEDEYSRFASTILESQQHVLALAWIRSGTDAGPAPSFSEIPMSDIAFDYVQPAGSRDLWVAATEALGTELREALVSASDSGDVIITGVIPGSISPTTDHLLLVIRAAYSNGRVPATPAGRRESIEGFAAAIVSMESIAVEAMSEIQGDGEGRFGLTIVDESSPDATPIRIGVQSTGGIVSQQRRYHQIVKIGSKEWLIEIAPLDESSVVTPVDSWLVLGLGLALTVLVSGFVASLLHQKTTQESLLATLRREERRYRRLLEEGHLLVMRVTAGPERRILLVNHEWKARVGVGDAGVGAQPIDAFLTADSLDAWSRAEQNLAAGSSRESLALEFLRSDGSIIRTVASLTRAIDDAPGAIDAVLVDQTDRLRASEIAAEARDFSDRIIRSIYVGLAVLDRDLNIVTANPAFCGLFAEDGASLHGASLLTLMSSDADRSSLRVLLEGVIRHSARFDDLELPVDDGSGTRRILRFSGGPIKPPGSDESLVLLTIQDDTKRRIAELEARHQAEELATHIERAGAPIIGIDQEGRVTVWNHRTEIITGYSKADVLGHPLEALFGKLVVPDRASMFRGFLQQALTGVELNDIEFGILTPSGGRVEILLSASPRHDVLGRLTGVLCVGQDVTALKRAEREKFQAQKLEALGELTGGIAHDFNNLLTVIQGNLELLRDELSDAPRETTIMLDDAMSAALEGSEAVRQLLAFTRRQPPSPRLLEIRSVINDFAGTLKRSIGHETHLVLDLGNEESRAIVDQSQLESALVSLAANARDAGPPGSPVVIRVRNGHRRTRGGQTRPDVDEFVEISVIDQGVGMTPDVRDRAIEPFFSTKGPGKGSGLGLSFVDEFARQSSGFLEIDSEEGSGTTVAIYLPRVGQAVTPQVSGDQEREATGSETILVVEDESLLRRFAATCLKSLGYRVIEAANAREALEALDQDAGVDLVLSDIVMPGGMNGLRLAEEIHERYPRIAVQLMTGFSDQLNGRSDSIGAAVLRKPFTRSELASAVRRALDHPSPRG